MRIYRKFATGSALSLLLLTTAPSALAGDLMPVDRQNTLVRQYCAVCHTDSVRNGGLTLQHFDAARVAPSLAAMMISKLTGGLSLETTQAEASDPAAATLLNQQMKGGAMGAAGIPVPDAETVRALVHALASEAAGAREWRTESNTDPATRQPLLTASILRESPSPTRAGAAAMYRLVLSCNPASHQGDMQLAWSPSPATGDLFASVDGSAPMTIRVEGSETMGNGAKAITAHAAVHLFDSGKTSGTPRILFPAQTLAISHLFPDQTVEFPFRELPQTTRRQFNACFSTAYTSR